MLIYYRVPFLFSYREHNVISLPDFTVTDMQYLLKQALSVHQLNEQVRQGNGKICSQIQSPDRRKNPRGRAKDNSAATAIEVVIIFIMQWPGARR